MMFNRRTFASSAPSGIVPQLMQQFGFSGEVGILTISIFVCGYCIGPLLWGPLSEQYGRRPIFILSFLGFLVCPSHMIISSNAFDHGFESLGFPNRLRLGKEHCFHA